MKLSVIGVVPGGMEPPPVEPPPEVVPGGMEPPPVGAGMPVVGEVIDKEISKRVGLGVDQRSKDRLEDKSDGCEAHNL